MADPVLGKVPLMPKLDHKLMTWPRFLTLRRWAQKVADETGLPIYLVGSVLNKSRPRDIDVAIVMPDSEYRKWFGDGLPKKGDVGYDPWWQFVIPHTVEAQKLVRWRTRVDVKVCSDAWWTDKPRLLLATPAPPKEDTPHG